MNDRFGLSDEAIDLIKRVFAGFPEVDEVIIFGSRAQGIFKPSSDIDLCLKGKNLDYSLVEQIRNLLQEGLYLPYKFDVLNYNKIMNQAVKESIDTYGKKLFGE